MNIERIIQTKGEIASAESRLGRLESKHLIKEIGFKVWAEARLDRNKPHKVKWIYIKRGFSESLAERKIRLSRQEFDALVEFHSELIALEGER